MSLLSRVSTWKFILPLFLLLCLFSFFIFPACQLEMRKLSGADFQPLDTRFSYTADEVVRDFERLGTEGRNVYRIVVGRVDMVYPVIYGLFFVLLMANLIKKITPPDSVLIMLSLLPLLGVFFDYLENLNTLKLLRNFPELTNDGVQWGELMTRLKHAIGLLSASLILLCAVVWIIGKFRKGKEPAANRGAARA